MNHILVIEIPDEHREALVKSLPPGSKACYDHQVDATYSYEAKFTKSWRTFHDRPEFDEYNWMFLRQQQNWFNDMLRSRGFVFLNEILIGIGGTPIPVGQLIGWSLQKGFKPHIDFGCWSSEKEHEPGTPITLKFTTMGIIEPVTLPETPES